MIPLVSVVGQGILYIMLMFLIEVRDYSDSQFSCAVYSVHTPNLPIDMHSNYAARSWSLVI